MKKYFMIFITLFCVCGYIYPANSANDDLNRTAQGIAEQIPGKPIYGRTMHKITPDIEITNHPTNPTHSDPIYAEIHNWFAVGLGRTIGSMLIFLIPLMIVWKRNRKSRIAMISLSGTISLLYGFIPSIFQIAWVLIWIACLIWAITTPKKKD